MPPTPPSSSAARRIAPPCWRDDETLALIDSYRDKCYSLRRANLGPAHWDDVAAAVNLRCHSSSSSSAAAAAKTTLQCRHKMEKLRRRYRSERLRSFSHWIFFPQMDRMENPNPNPLSHHHRRHHHHLRNHESDSDEDGRDESHAIPFGIPNPNCSILNKGGLENAGGLEEETRGKRLREKDEENDGLGRNWRGEMVRAVRMLGESYVRTEKMKMQMARETESARMEMEQERTRMILDTQRRIFLTLLKGFRAGKKVIKEFTESLSTR